jgi:hypothetical protein
MARYTGPKTELLVNLAKQYSEMTKHSKEELPTWTTRDGEKGKNLNMLSRMEKPRKLNILMEF